MSGFISFWLAIFVLNFGILGLNMYNMLVFTDLGNDYINPHEATRRVNATVIPELAAIALMALLHLFAFDPLLLLLLPVVLLKAHKFRRKQLVLDVTDIFSRAKAEKVERLWLTIGMAINFVFTVVCVVDVAIGAYEFRHALPDGSPGPRSPAHHHHGQRVVNG